MPKVVLNHTQTKLYLIPDSFSSLWVCVRESWVESMIFFSENSLNQSVIRDHLGSCFWLIMWLSQGMFCRWNYRYPERIFCNNNRCNYITTFCMFHCGKLPILWKGTVASITLQRSLDCFFFNNLQSKDMVSNINSQ